MQPIEQISGNPAISGNQPITQIFLTEALGIPDLGLGGVGKRREVDATQV